MILWQRRSIEINIPRGRVQKISYLQAGDKGPPLLLLHGLGADSTMWGKNIPFLARHFRLYALDLPGMGLSPWAGEEINPDYYADVIFSFCRQGEKEPLFVIGASFGGELALLFAARYPQLVRAMVLAAPSALTPPVGGFFRRPLLPVLALRLFAFSPPAASFLFPSCRPLFAGGKEWVRQLQSYLKEKKNRRLYRRLVALAGSLLTEKELAGADLPVLLVWGEEDTVIPLAAARKLSSCLPRVQVRFFPKCGHDLPLAAYRQFNLLCLEFFTSLC